MTQIDKKILCAIYRSERRAGTYLYLPWSSSESGLDSVQPALLESLGELTEVMKLNLHAGRKLAGAKIENVMRDLSTLGFYLQLPPGEGAPSLAQPDS